MKSDLESVRGRDGDSELGEGTARLVIASAREGGHGPICTGGLTASGGEPYGETPQGPCLNVGENARCRLRATACSPASYPVHVDGDCRALAIGAGAQQCLGDLRVGSWGGGPSVFSRMTPLAPSSAAFFRIELYIFASSVNSASPLNWGSPLRRTGAALPAAIDTGRPSPR